MRNTKRRHLVLTLTLAASMVFCLVPSATSAAERTVNPGHHHVDVDIYKVPASEQGGVKVQGTETYLEKLDPRNEDWYKDNIEVRDQYNSSLCWSFSANKAAMISYAKECAEDGSAQVPETSPIHLGYFFYNRVNDPLGQTGGDYNYNTQGENWFTEGGSVVNTFQHMATWSGLSNERNAPFSVALDPDKGEYVYNGPMDLSFGLSPQQLQSLAYNNEFLETESTFYARGDQNDLKYVVSQHGAAVVSLFFGNRNISLDDYINRIDDPESEYYGTMNFYNPDGYKQNNNHEVVVIGWDDDYPASNFISEKHDGSGDVVSPANDGAWLVMNSWGTNWGGDGGYFWVSYDSEDILSDGICGFRMTKPDSYRYNFQYDGHANNDNYNLSKGDIAANVFTNTTGEKIRLDAIGFTEYNDGPTDYDVKIYTSLTDPDLPTSGELASFMKVTTHTPGYKTFQLDQELPYVEIEQNDTYSIVVTAENDETYFGVESTGAKYSASIEEGQSYGWDPKGGWEDMESYDVCYRIKGLANAIDDPKPTTTEPPVPRTTDPQPTSATTTTTAPTAAPDPSGGGSQIKLKATKITSIKKGNKSLTVKWKKSRQIVEGKHVTGYQIRYSLKRNMKNAKTVTVKGFAKTSKKIKKLKKKKTYYVQVRTIYIDDRGVEHSSAWSKKKSKKTR